MGMTRSCDICSKKIVGYDFAEVRSWGSRAKKGEYCLTCWKDQKNWPKMHVVKTEDKKSK
jgi:hypothetical protein